MISILSQLNRVTLVKSMSMVCSCLLTLGVIPGARGQCLEAHPVASNGAANDAFGISTAIAGDTLVVGASDDDTMGGTNAGSAYVFVRSGGEWVQQAQLFASDGAPGDFFGVSVAISGDTIVVGALADNTLSGGTDAGSAYVFVRDGSTWAQQAHLFASDGAANDLFGTSVSISGDTVVITALRDDKPGAADAGSAYVFVRDGTIWTEQAHLFGSAGAAGDSISWVKISGDTLIMGSQLDNTTAGIDAGSAYVFVRSEDVWTEEAQLFASDGSAGDGFGYAVTIDGDTAVVGAVADDTVGGVDAGSAYVFVRSAGTWTEQTHLFASDGAAGDHFTSDFGVSGDTLVIGASDDDTANGTDAGSAYVFTRAAAGTTWTETARLFAFDGAAADRSGYAIALWGDTTLVGAYQHDMPAAAGTGSTYVFDLGCTPGDLNCDDAVNIADMPHLIEALLATGFTGCDINRADVNADGLKDGRDVPYFVNLLVP